MADATAQAAQFSAFEAAGWDRRADSYDGFFGSITGRLVEPLLDAGRVRQGSRVLDVATGPGYVAGGALRRGARVTAIDVAPSMVELARRRHPGVNVRIADAEALPFAPGSFDTVVANFLLMHLGRPERAMSEMVRVLAPGGMVALTAWGAPDRARFVGVFVDAAAAAGAAPPPDLPTGPSFFRFSDESELVRLFAGAGMRCQVETVSFGYRWPSPDALWHGLLGATVRISALIQGQSGDVRRRIRAEFDRIVADHVTPHGVELPVSVKLAVGRAPVAGRPLAAAA